MAKRYSSTHSPRQSGDQANSSAVRAESFAGKKRTKAGGRVNLMFFVAIPLAIRAFQGTPSELAQNLLAFGLLILAAWLTREGVIAHEAYDARKTARKPAIPRKILGSIALALGLGLAGFSGAASLMNVAVFMVAGVVLHLFAFGPDPLRDKGLEGVDSFQQDRVTKAVDQAEAHLQNMKREVLRAGDRRLTERVEQFGATARTMFRTIEDDPRDLTGARKFLGVYLQGARDATAKFADLYARNGNSDVRADYEALLDDLELNFAAQTEKMLLDDRTDMDIEIKVLRDRLRREGLSASGE